jgi:mRNA interferase RelE/StbE
MTAPAEPGYYDLYVADEGSSGAGRRPGVGGRHEVVVTASAERDIDRLPERSSDAVRKFFKGPLRNNPRKAGAPLAGERRTMFEALGPDWRVLYQIDANTSSVKVMVVAPRRAGDARER